MQTKYKYNGRKLVFLFMHIKLGLPSIAFSYLLYANICSLNFLFFSFNLNPVCGILHYLIRVAFAMYLF